MAAPPRPRPLADLLAEAGVPLTPDHEHVVALLEETGWEQAACSLLRSFAASMIPAPRTVLRSAHYAYHVACPDGADPVASEGLPSYMTVGADADGPWWHCTRHVQAHRGLVDVAYEVTAAKDHLATFHRGWRGDE